MNFIFPLIKFSTKERLEELQNGTMYLKNACYYRVIEKENGDTIQGDKYDCNIPYFGDTFDQTPNTNNTAQEDKSPYYLMRANTFISCFYALKGSNVVGFRKDWMSFGFREHKEKIKEFGDYALVICDVNSFIQSFVNAKIDCEFRLYGDVKYSNLDISNEANVITNKLIGNCVSIKKSQNIQEPIDYYELIKNIKYNYQQ